MARTRPGRPFHRLATAAILALALCGVAVPVSFSVERFSTTDRQEIEAIIQEYIRSNPDVIIDSVRNHQRQEEQASRVRAQEEMVESRPKLEKDPGAPVVGNKDGDVTIVEFFDYQCGYCKKVFSDVMNLVKSDGNIRYVLKEFPVLGPDSVTAARASLAVWASHPDRYLDYHTALMSSRGALSEQRVLDIAKDLGLNPNELRVAMQKPEIDAQIQSVRDLAERLNLRGTPAFVIGDELVPGAVGLDALKLLVERARQG